MAIILDTNILFKNRILEHSEFIGLLWSMKRNEDEIYLFDIILEEFKVLMRAEFKKNLRELNKNATYFKSFTSNVETIDLDLEILIESYVYKFLKKLNIDNNRILSTENLPIKNITSRAIKKLKPFNINGNGYKDNVIWEAIKYYSDSKFDKKVSFISNNSKDFAQSKNDPDVLASNLKEELEEIVLDFQLFNSISSYINANYKSFNESQLYDNQWLKENYDSEHFVNPILDKLNSAEYINDFLLFMKENQPNTLISDYIYFYLITIEGYSTGDLLKKGDTNEYLLQISLYFTSLVEYEVVSTDSSEYYSYVNTPFLVEKEVDLIGEISFYISDDKIQKVELKQLCFQTIN
ncbi:hypothetical protein J2X69_003039 [Algoriphagus sp. 4150]|uniref:PIN domain-containing protein n=1 Tax=Algoriphagus sp. 4150 TaxID=2817756 RepID=UPI00286210EC|nr:PIN domain-containing protein [Algoriphagus sp. 4150]MDR7130682.1 hypothetical protein [Algoriphagus sp. 4150]